VNLGYLGHLALLPCFRWALFLGWRAISLKIELTEEIEEVRDRRSVVLQFVVEFVLRLVNESKAHVLILAGWLGQALNDVPIGQQRRVVTVGVIRFLRLSCWCLWIGFDLVCEAVLLRQSLANLVYISGDLGLRLIDKLVDELHHSLDLVESRKDLSALLSELI